MYDMNYLWPLSIAIGLAVFTLSFVLPEPAVALVLRVVAVVLFVLAAIFSIPGIA
jgi:hypothetical protein